MKPPPEKLMEWCLVVSLIGITLATCFALVGGAVMAAVK